VPSTAPPPPTQQQPLLQTSQQSESSSSQPDGGQQEAGERRAEQAPSNPDAGLCGGTSPFALAFPRRHCCVVQTHTHSPKTVKPGPRPGLMCRLPTAALLSPDSGDQRAQAHVKDSLPHHLTPTPLPTHCFQPPATVPPAQRLRTAAMQQRPPPLRVPPPTTSSSSTPGGMQQGPSANQPAATPPSAAALPPIAQPLQRSCLQPGPCHRPTSCCCRHPPHVAAARRLLPAPGEGKHLQGLMVC
jgi:hypothetical protein